MSREVEAEFSSCGLRRAGLMEVKIPQQQTEVMRSFGKSFIDDAPRQRCVSWQWMGRRGYLKGRYGQIAG